MNINYNKVFTFSKPFFILLLISYFLSMLFFIFLPKSSIEFEESNVNTLTYSEYKGFYSQGSNISLGNEIKSQVGSIKKLSDYRLKAIYAKEDLSGWIIVENIKNNDSLILEQDSNLDNYILKKLYKNYVIFLRDEVEYKLVIPEDSSIKYEMQRINNNVEEKVIVNGNKVKLERSYLNQYVTNIEKVWNNIAISDYKTNGKLDGFIVNKINKSSVFAKLGLKKGDIIKSVNGNKLKSYADAFKVYNNINKIDYLSLEIERNKEMMEISYEID